MARVSYRAMLEETSGPPARWAALTPEDVPTRRREATKAREIRISPDQRRWLREVEEQAGRGVDADAVVRALLDVARRLDVDWSLLRGPAELRRAVAGAVRVRRSDDPATPADSAGP